MLTQWVVVMPMRCNRGIQWENRTYTYKAAYRYSSQESHSVHIWLVCQRLWLTKQLDYLSRQIINDTISRFCLVFCSSFLLLLMSLRAKSMVIRAWRALYRIVSNARGDPHLIWRRNFRTQNDFHTSWCKFIKYLLQNEKFPLCKRIWAVLKNHRKS